MTAAPAAAVPLLPRRAADPDALAECADEIIAKLAQAASPVILVDVEIRRYDLERRVTALARKLGLPVVTTFMGRGLLEDAPDVLLGTYLGAAGDPTITRLVEDADALLLLGVILSDTNFALSQRRFDPRRMMLAFDREVRGGHHVYPNLPIDDLIDALAARARRLAAADARANPVAVDYPRGLRADDQPVVPSDIAAAINDLFDRHGAMPMTADIGDCLFTAMEIENTALAAPGYYAGMGFGVPGGIGVAAATGRRPLALVGDGAFQMTGWELGNCRRYGLDPMVVLVNNASWEMLRAFQPKSRFNDLDDWNFAAIAPSLGGHGERVRTRRELSSALERRGRTARPVLAGGGHAAAQCDLADAGAFRGRFPGEQESVISEPCSAQCSWRRPRARCPIASSEWRGCRRSWPAVPRRERGPAARSNSFDRRCFRRGRCSEADEAPKPLADAGRWQRGSKGEQ
jgi:indolepyruvate decarboxylase